jgi:hypothetical protein
MKITIIYNILDLDIISKIPQLYPEHQFKYLHVDENWLNEIDYHGTANAMIISTEIMDKYQPCPEWDKKINQKYDKLFIFTHGTQGYEQLLWEKMKHLTVLYDNQLYRNKDILYEIHYAHFLERVINIFNPNIIEENNEEFNMNDFDF